jgi:hypothetical protein
MQELKQSRSPEQTLRTLLRDLSWEMCMDENFVSPSHLFSVRPFEARDREAVFGLWPAEVMHLPPGSQTVDVLNNSVEGAIAGKHHVWVAESSARIIGSAAVISDDPVLAHLRYLCVAPDVTARDVVVRTLAETAIRDAWERGYLKLLVHTNSPPGQPAAFLHELGFEFSRERSRGGEHVLEFYLNLYELPRPSSSGRK